MESLWIVAPVAGTLTPKGSPFRVDPVTYNRTLLMQTSPKRSDTRGRWSFQTHAKGCLRSFSASKILASCIARWRGENRSSEWGYQGATWWDNWEIDWSKAALFVVAMDHMCVWCGSITHIYSNTYWKRHYLPQRWAFRFKSFFKLSYCPEWTTIESIKSFITSIKVQKSISSIHWLLINLFVHTFVILRWLIK